MTTGRINQIAIVSYSDCVGHVHPSVVLALAIDTYGDRGLLPRASREERRGAAGDAHEQTRHQSQSSPTRHFGPKGCLDLVPNDLARHGKVGRRTRTLPDAS